MKKYLPNLISFGPVILFNIYSFSTKEPDSGINWTHVYMSAIIATIGVGIGNSIKNKGKVK
jgi:hypothetical protein